MALRTKEQGLLTTADAFAITNLHMELQASAHGGDSLAGLACSGCKALWDAFCEWISAHAASEEELDELEAARPLK